jgi:hypothetical protein
MDGSFLLPALAFATLGIVLVLAIISKRKTDARRDDPNAPKSTLASDAPNEHGPSSSQTSDRQSASGETASRPVEPKPNPPQPSAPQQPRAQHTHPDQSRTGQ